jgi:hypothetical protein
MSLERTNGDTFEEEEMLAKKIEATVAKIQMALQEASHYGGSNPIDLDRIKREVQARVITPEEGLQQAGLE